MRKAIILPLVGLRESHNVQVVLAQQHANLTKLLPVLGHARRVEHTKVEATSCGLHWPPGLPLLPPPLARGPLLTLLLLARGLLLLLLLLARWLLLTLLLLLARRLLLMLLALGLLLLLPGRGAAGRAARGGDAAGLTVGAECVKANILTPETGRLKSKETVRQCRASKVQHALPGVLLQ